MEPDDLDEEEKEDRDSKMSIDIVGSDEVEEEDVDEEDD